MAEKLRELYSYREFFFTLLYHQLHQRYQGSILGFLWTLLHPLLTFASFSLVFSLLNRWDLRDYGVYFFSGYVVWTFFSNSCTSAADSILNHRVFVTRVYSPKAIFPLMMVAINFIDMLAGLAILIALKIFVRHPFGMSLLILPLSFLLLIAFTTGVSLICAQWNVFFRDFRHLLASFLFIWFFFTPIVWKADAMPANAREFIWYNPAAHFLSLFQNPLWANKLPPTSSLILTSTTAAGALIAGLYLFFRSEKKFFYYI